MRTERDTQGRLEWGGVVDMIASRTRTPMGRDEADSLRPFREEEDIRRAQARVAEMRLAHARSGRLPITAVEDPAPVLQTLQIAGKVLDGREVYETVRLLSVARAAATFVERLEGTLFSELRGLVERMPDLSGIVDTIEGNVTPQGLIEDQASPELGRVRREMRHLKESVTRILEGLLNAEWNGPVLRDRYVTSRNNRFVVPVRTDTPRRLPGIVHGSSDSQKTLFVEPMETVEINNQLVALGDEEEAEIERILAGYTELLRASAEDIARTAHDLGALDMLEAVAGWAEDHRAVRPDIAPGAGLRFRGARHPVLEQTLMSLVPPVAIVPLDVDLARETRVLVISGPNAGGKTVALKTIGLLTLMAHAGLPVPATEARVPPFERIVADIGDEQSIQGSLSTFASHVKNLAGMIEGVHPPGLALIDEIGTGTDPGEGAALGIAVLERLRSEGLHVVATTHHAAIKAWAYRTDGVQNAACDFDDVSLRPTYRLVAGVAGASIGLTMARQLGLDDAVVADAERRLDPSGVEASALLDSVRSLASDLESQREQIAEHRRRLDQESAAREAAMKAAETRREAEWARRVEALLRDFRADADRVVARLSDERERRALEKERARRERELRMKYAAENEQDRRAAAPPDWQPAEAERVYVVSLDKEGAVRAVRGRRVEVALGHAVFTVPLDDLRPLGKSEAAAAQGNATPQRPKPGSRKVPSGVTAQIADRTVPLEMHLLGMRVDEAIETLDHYLDDVLLAGYREVRIIHGYGTGALKRAVREFLDAHEEVLSWREAPPNEGGGGATIARLEEEG